MGPGRQRSSVASEAVMVMWLPDRVLWSALSGQFGSIDATLHLFPYDGPYRAAVLGIWPV